MNAKDLLQVAVDSLVQGHGINQTEALQLLRSAIWEHELAVIPVENPPLDKHELAGVRLNVPLIELVRLYRARTGKSITVAKVMIEQAREILASQKPASDW